MLWRFQKGLHHRCTWKRRRMRSLALLGIGTVVLSGCFAITTAPQGVTSTQAILHASVSCSANTTTNPCQGYFQYWQDGQQGNPQKLPTTPIVANASYSNVDISETATSLTPGQLYHYQWCGQGDQNVTQTMCVGSWNDGTNPPSSPPSAIDATANFVTPNPQANPPTSTTVDYGRNPSSSESSNAVLYARDGGASVQFSTNPPKSLWTFGDSLAFDGNGNWVGGVVGSTAATATYTAGQPAVSLTEVQTGFTSSKGLYQFLGPSAPLSNCQNGQQIRYPGPMAKEPGSSKIVLVFTDTCLTNGTYNFENIGITEYDPIANAFTQPKTIVFSAPSGLPGRELFNGAAFYGTDGYLYLYSVEGGSVYLARVPANAASWTSSSNYQWYNNGSWGPAAQATPVTTGASGFGTSVGYSPAKGVFAMQLETFSSFRVRSRR